MLQSFRFSSKTRGVSVYLCVSVSALYLTSLKSKAIREARWWAGLTVNSCALTEEACNKDELWQVARMAHRYMMASSRTRRHKPTVTIMGTVTAGFNCIVWWGHGMRGWGVCKPNEAGAHCTHMHDHSHIHTQTYAHTDDPPHALLLKFDWTSSVSSEFKQCSLSEALHSLSPVSAWPAHSPTENTNCLPVGKPLKLQYYIPPLYLFLSVSAAFAWEVLHSPTEYNDYIHASWNKRVHVLFIISILRWKAWKTCPLKTAAISYIPVTKAASLLQPTRTHVQIRKTGRRWSYSTGQL